MATKTFDTSHGKQVAIMYNLFPMLEEDKKPLWLSLSKPMPIHKADLVVFVQRLNSLALYPGVS